MDYLIRAKRLTRLKISSSKPSKNCFPLSLGARHIQEYFNNKRWRKGKFINPKQEKAKYEERMKQSKVIVQEQLVVGHWEFIPMESGDELSAPQGTSTVRFAKERPAAKK